MSPLARQSNTTFSISVSVWLTSPRQSGNYQCVPTNTNQAQVRVHVLDGKILFIVILIKAKINLFEVTC